jgi:hypothetical protein
VHSLLVRETLPRSGTPSGVAVNQSTRHIYVAAGLPQHVYNLDEDGKLDLAIPELETATINPFYVAVDNSGGSKEGYIYSQWVLEGIVQQFAPSGARTGVTITDASIPAAGTPQGAGLPPVVNDGEFSPRELAVDNAGHLFVYDQTAQVIDEFTSAGTFIAQLAAGKIREITGMALDGLGDIYVTRTAPNGIGMGLFELDGTTGECVQIGCAPISPEPMLGVAVDQSTGDIFTTGLVSEEHGFEGEFSEYDPAGTLLGVTHPKALHDPEGIAIDEASGRVVVGDTLPREEGTLQIFSPVTIVPDAESLPPETVADHRATLRGEIGAAGVAGATCHFQIASEEEFAKRSFEGAAEIPCSPTGPFSGAEMHEVKAEAEGLEAGTVYRYRLVGENENGENTSEVASFTTHGPRVAGESVSEVAGSAATLTGLVNPRGEATVYRFQYLTQGVFENVGWGGAVEAPVGGTPAGSGTSAIEVRQRVEGLSAGVTYRFRLVASNAGGEASGLGVRFATLGATPVFGPCPNDGFRNGGSSASLPDCRAYEQVSPVEKSGTNIEGEFNAVAVAPNGEAITFYTSAGLPNSDAAQTFPSYMASRAADGTSWSTQDLLPPPSSGWRAVIVGWNEELSEAYSWVTGKGAPLGLIGRSTSDGSIRELGHTSNLAGDSPFAFAGASTGGGIAVVESSAGGVAGLTPQDAAGKQNAYIYDRQSGRLMLVGVMNDGTAPSGGSMAGPYDWYSTGSTTGLGGAAHNYYTKAMHVISTDGHRVFFTAGGTGQLYLRQNPLAAQSAMNGEECTEAVTKACTIRISAPEDGVPDPGTPAAFLGASSVGSVVYFLDSGKLTSDATGGSGANLYSYDVDSGELTDLSVDSTDLNGARVEGALGISDDGSHAYFVAAGAIDGTGASQAPGGETNLYAVAGSAVSFIARLGSGEAEARNWIPRSRQGGEETTTHTSRVSGGEGGTLLFTSSRQLTSYDNDGQDEIYLFRSGEGLNCISCNPTGEAPAGPAGVQQMPHQAAAPKLLSAIMTRNLSTDGRRVIFDSADRLVAADKNNVNDVYEWEEEGEGSCESNAENGGCIYLISGGAEGAEPSYFAGADEKGKEVFFFTTDQLVAQDRDQLDDIYDARVEGGIGAQEVRPAAACESESDCALGAAPAPPTATPLSPGAVGSNLTPKPACKKGAVRKNGKCVKKKKAKHPHKHKKEHKHAAKKKSQKGSSTGGRGR